MQYFLWKPHHCVSHSFAFLA